MESLSTEYQLAAAIGFLIVFFIIIGRMWWELIIRDKIKNRFNNKK